MICCCSGELVIRRMEEADAPVFVEEYTAQGWHPDIEVYRKRLRDQEEGKCVALTAVWQGRPAGAVYVYRTVQEGPFKGKGWPIIVDFTVLEKYQRKGIGSRLMDAAEETASQYADTVCLGVGLCKEYGSAQRMYVKRGYIPDGSGVWYRDRQCVQYETACTVDDDLVLYLSKKLPGKDGKAARGPQAAENREAPGQEDAGAAYTVRKVTVGDYDALYALWNSTEQSRRALNPVDDSREGIAKYLERNPDTCFAAVKDGRIIGVILTGHDGRRGVIHHMCVHPDYRRMGIAARLAATAEEALKEEGIGKVFGLVFKDNEPANAFWERQGYSLRTNLNYRNKSLNEAIPAGK